MRGNSVSSIKYEIFICYKAFLVGERETPVSFVTRCDDVKNLRNKDSYEEPALIIMDVMISFLIEQ